MLRLKTILQVVILIVMIQSVCAISNVQHNINGNTVTLTYDGNPPFLINIRSDSNIGQNGGYVWAKTYSNKFTIDLNFANNPSKKFYYAVKDKINTSDINMFDLNQQQDIIYLTSCTTINRSGNYLLQKDIVADDTCFLINSDNIALDLNNHIIKGIQSQYAFGIWINNSNNISIKNGEIHHFGTGVLMDNCNNNELRNMYLHSNVFKGLHMTHSSNNKILNNRISYNPEFGLLIDSSSENNFINNTIERTKYLGMEVIYSSKNIFSGNNILNNRFAINKFETSENQYNYNIFSGNYETGFSFLESNRSRTVGDTIDFSFNIKNFFGENCPSCSFHISLYPDEPTFNYELSGDLLSGSFIPTKQGIYSIKLKVIDEYGNSEIRKYIFLLNPIEGQANYYFREFEPTHGQPLVPIPAVDVGSLSIYPPNENEYRRCGGWILFCPDDLPPNLFGIYKNIDMSIWYNTSNWGHLGVQEFVTYYSDVDLSIWLPTSSGNIIFTNRNFSVDWVNDYFWKWYYMSIKLEAQSPWIYSSPANPSYANITYLYSNTPSIQKITNENIELLSATMKSQTSESANLTLYGEGMTDLSVKMPIFSKLYYVYYDGIECELNDQCSINFQSNGKIDLTLFLDSEHSLEIR